MSTTPFIDAILADSPTFFLAITETSGVSLVDSVAADNGVLTPESGGAWTGGTMDLPGGSTDAGDKSILINGTSGMLAVASGKINIHRDHSVMWVIKKPESATGIWSVAKRQDSISSGSAGLFSIDVPNRLVAIRMTLTYAWEIPESVDITDWMVIHFCRQSDTGSGNEILAYINGVASPTGPRVVGSELRYDFNYIGRTHSNGYSPVGLSAVAQFDQELSALQVSNHFAAFEGTGGEGVPDKVTGLTATLNGATSIDWTWAADETADTYQIEVNGTATTGLTTEAHETTGLIVGTAYSARVRGINTAGPGAWSDFVRVGDPFLYWLQIGADATSEMIVNCERYNIDGISPGIEYRKVGSETWLEGVGTAEDWPYLAGTREVHRVKLSGLDADSDYEWRWLSIGLVRYFKTLPASLSGGKSVRAVVAGDIYQSPTSTPSLPRAILLAEDMRERDPDFVVVNGDWAYADGLEIYLGKWDQLLDFFTTQMTHSDGRVLPLLPVIGNHESTPGDDTPASAPYFYGFFDLPNNGAFHEVYAGDWLSFLALDSGHTVPDYTVDGEQTLWVAGRLAARSSTTHKIPAWHLPYYPANRPITNNLLSARNFLAPVLESGGVRTAFTAHTHLYHVTPRIASGAVVSDDAETGVKYFGEGCWGAGIATDLENSEAWWFGEAHTDDIKGRHFHLVEFRESQLTIESVGSDGVTFDTYLDPPLAEPELTTITVSPSAVTIDDGDDQQFTATGLDQYGNPFELPTITWSVESGLGSIDSSGLYTSAGETTAVVRATVGDVFGEATVTVEAEVVDPDPPTIASLVFSTPGSRVIRIAGVAGENTNRIDYLIQDAPGTSAGEETTPTGSQVVTAGEAFSFDVEDLSPGGRRVWARAANTGGD